MFAPSTEAAVSKSQAAVPATCVPCSCTASALEPFLAALLANILATDHLVVREPGVTELLGCREAGVAETRVRDVDAGIDDADLDASSGVLRTAGRIRGRPTLFGADDAEVGVGGSRCVRRLVPDGDH